MRDLTPELDNASPPESFLRVLDQFAALRTYAGDTPVVGGYRVLAPQRSNRRPFAAHPAALAALARARMRLTGFLSVLFVGGLGLAVLAGPANCPCASTYAGADQSSLARLGYVGSMRLMSARETGEAELPTLSAATLLKPEVSAAGVSPITTSALEPSREIAAVKGDDLAAIDSPRLPVKVEPLVDAKPITVRLAAAPSVESDLPPTLPVVEVATPPRLEITATDAEREPAPRAQSVHKRRMTRAYRAASPARLKKPGGPLAPQSAPKWAQQMFVTPWQSQAFSYTR